jgi:hypothetical protein
MPSHRAKAGRAGDPGRSRGGRAGLAQLTALLIAGRFSQHPVR